MENITYIRPEILTHPNLPKPLHGLNPRTIMGQEWWNIERQKAYASTNYCCAACGVHKSKAKKHKWLEAHEYHTIDYQTGICEIMEIVPLCHYCHNFIHSGRLEMIIYKEKSKEEVVEILEHGFKILSQNNLKCFKYTYSLAKQLKVNTFGVEWNIEEINPNLKWNDFKLIFNKTTYNSKFKTYQEWLNFYNK